MTDFPSEPPADPNDETQIHVPVRATDETQVHIPEFKRESDRGLPWLGIAVIGLLIIAGIGLLTFALVYGQGESENRAINGTVAAVMAFTPTPSRTREATSTPVPTLTVQPSDTATNTPVPETPTIGPTSTIAASATNTRPPANTVVPVTPTPVPPTNTPAPAFGPHGISGSLQLCDPGKTTYAAKAQTSIGLIEQICIYETIRNHTDHTVTYGWLGVHAQNISGGPSQDQASWQGELKINAGCSGPTGDGCGGTHTDTGFFMNTPGTYVLTLDICYSNVDVCQTAAGEWERLTSGITIEVISWTPSP